ncbi:hypothetical protein FRC09_012654 [Ceratobasidium sp. 395]|nr:hypothetical protein FRC09_012654 [Ceratobasidium sp. 395]
MSRTEVIPLSPLIFGSTRPISRPEARAKDDRPAPTRYTGSGLKPNERLATETLGEELMPDSVIWRMYLDEAKEHDAEMVDEKDKNLDVMLLFAALFSAVLTAFIVESKKLLQEDPSDLSATLLLAIAQSQQRMEQGAAQTTAPIERPQFTPSISARWVNGLWFSALSLSLGAALIAMLAKEWLHAFTTSRPRPPKSYALEHQFRLQGLIRWRALEIVDILPTMLHLSLLFFSLGLALYLWTIETGVAIAQVVITATILLFYAGSVLSSAIYTACPFDTQLSKHLRALLQHALLDKPDSENESKDVTTEDTGAETTNDELHALLWLMRNARDPEPEESPAISALNTIDRFWNGDRPGLSPDVYALILAAELRLIETITLAYCSDPLPENLSFSPTSPAALEPMSIVYNSTPSTPGVAIQMTSESRQPSQEMVSLFQLRARYSRVLVRIGSLLGHYNDHPGSISAQPLVYLLESIRLPAQCTELNPAFHMSTCLIQTRNSDALPLFQMRDTGISMEPLDIGNKDLIISGLLQVISSAGASDIYDVEQAGRRALHIIGPILFRQWAHMVDNLPENAQRDSTALQFVENALVYWPPLDTTGKEDGASSRWALKELFVIATAALSLAEYKQVSELPDTAMAALYQKANARPGRAPLFFMVKHNSGLFTDLVRYACLNHDKVPSDAIDTVVRLLVIKRCGVTLFRHGSTSPDSIPYVLRLLGKLPHHLPEVELILSEILGKLKGEDQKRATIHPYISPFTVQPDGFASLLCVAEQPEYVMATVNCIMKITHIVCEYQILAPAIPPFLEAVQLVVDKIISKPRKIRLLEDFVSDFMVILRTLDPEANQVVKGCPAMSTIHRKLRSKSDPPNRLAGLISELETWVDGEVVSQGD